MAIYDISEIPRLLKEARQERGVSLRGLSDEIGIPFNNLSRYERGQVNWKVLRYFLQVVAWLGLNASDFDDFDRREKIMSDPNVETPPKRQPLTDPYSGGVGSFAWYISQQGCVKNESNLPPDEWFLLNLEKIEALRRAFAKCLNEGAGRGDFAECEYQLDEIMSWHQEETNRVFQRIYWLVAKDLNAQMERHPDLNGYNHLAGHWAEAVRQEGGKVEV